MNRVMGDYFETLLYKIFVSIDEHTSVAEVSRISYMGQVTKMRLSCYLVLLSFDSKTR